jgi:hypothetical protein
MVNTIHVIELTGQSVPPRQRRLKGLSRLEFPLSLTTAPQRWVFFVAYPKRNQIWV